MRQHHSHEVFVSYRRGDDSAEVVRDVLESALYRGVCYFDRSDQPPGDYRYTLGQTIRNCRCVVLVVGVVFELRFEQLRNLGDVVRLEVTTAHQHDIPIIPVVMTGRDPRDLDWAAVGLGFLTDQHTEQIAADSAPRRRALLRRRLVPLLAPELPKYWRSRDIWARRAIRWVLAPAAAVLLGTLILLFATGADAWLHEALTRRARMTNDSLPKPTVKSVDEYLDTPSKDNPAQEANVNRDRYLMERWIREVEHRLEPRTADRPDRFRGYVATANFDRNYKSFNARVRTNSGFRIVQAYAYLKSNDGKAESPYRPVLRQLKVNYEPVEVQDPYRLIHNIEPNQGETLFLVLFVVREDPAQWGRVGENVGLSLEVD